MASEEAKVIKEENSTEVLTAFNRIPYALINAEVSGAAKDTLDELTQICQYYKVYKKGASFTVEGTNGDYIPAKLKYKMAASLIIKERRGSSSLSHLTLRLNLRETLAKFHRKPKML